MTELLPDPGFAKEWEEGGGATGNVWHISLHVQTAIDTDSLKTCMHDMYAAMV